MQRLIMSIAIGLITLGACTKGDAGQKKTENVKLGMPLVAFETSRGTIVIKLNGDKAPISTRNMLEYVESGFYNGTIFHRVIPDFMIQGGGFTPDLKQKSTRAAIKNEAENGLSNTRGSVAMARTNVVDSATAQFFINTKDNRQLDHSADSFGYAVIGEVVEGMDVVDVIRNVLTRCPSWTGEACTEDIPNHLRDVPKEAVIIQKAFKK